MSEKQDNQKESNVKSTIDAVKGLAEAIPVYQDAIQPAAQEVGKSLITVAKTVNIALAPVGALVWGYEKIKDFIIGRVTERLRNTKENKIVTPDPAIVGPSLEALKYSGNDENLRELYATLIATSMDADTVVNAHPGFVQIIRNLSSDEALLMTYFHNNHHRKPSHPVVEVRIGYFNSQGQHTLARNISLLHKNANLKNPDLTSSYIDNLCRLGLIEIPEGLKIADDKYYDEIIKSDIAQDYEKFALDRGIIDYRKRFITMTDFGRQFCDACIGRIQIEIKL